MNTAILHYSAPPVVGGVEAVISAHAEVFQRNGYPVTVVAGRGDPSALPAGAGWIRIPEMDSQHPEILKMSAELDAGRVPDGFQDLVSQLAATLSRELRPFHNVIVHNIFSKHFNLPLTAALARLLENGQLRNPIAWCHDFTWSSPHSRDAVHPGYPWELLRKRLTGLTYVVVSEKRCAELAEISNQPTAGVHVIYNGVNFAELLGLSSEGADLIERLGMRQSDLNLLMPVRITQAKNIEYALQLTHDLKLLELQPRLVVTGPPDPHDPQNMAYYDQLRMQRKEMNIREEARFVYESGLDPSQPYLISQAVVYDLLRASDLMLMPSHREGFGMPIVEAGLAGVPVVTRSTVPAAYEIAQDSLALDLQDKAAHQAAKAIAGLAKTDRTLRLRRKVRQQLTWQTIFYRQIEPLLVRGSLP
jgi:glycosyltransferase involved in cell wall biosynthesis